MNEAGVEEIIFRSPETEVAAWVSGVYLCVRATGRFGEDFAEVMRTRVLNQNRSLALDLSLLTNIPMHFARELYFLSTGKRQEDHRLILVRPPDYLRSLLNIISERGVSSVSDFRRLPADPRDVERMAKEQEETLARIRRNLQTNPLWQFVDRESCWICPFCAASIEDVRIVSRVNIPVVVVENSCSHLLLHCPKYDPNRPSALDGKQLEDAVARINSEKFAASREHARELQSKVTRLEKKSRWADQMEKGLKVAVERQKHLLPTGTPDISGVKISLVYRPAEQIGGDFYDFIDMGDGREGIVIGDVSGHGIEAGILMGMTKKVLQIRVVEMPDLRQAVLRANADIYREMGRKSFVTAFVSVLDPARKLLTCVRAGHNPLLLVNPARDPDTLQVEPSGTVLGMAVGPVIERAMNVREIRLQAGDLIVYYTDGLEEAHNPGKDMFGRERILEILRREYSRPVGYILGALSYELDRFTAGVPQEDDVTMIGLKIESAVKSPFRSADSTLSGSRL